MATIDNKPDAMKPAEDLADLSRRFVNLWQEQARLMAHDPATAQVMAQSTAMMTQMLSGQWPATPMGGFPAMPDLHAPPASTPPTQEMKDDTSRSPAAAPASGERDQLLHELLERIDKLERRIDDLASKPDGKGGGTKKRSGGARKK